MGHKKRYFLKKNLNLLIKIELNLSDKPPLQYVYKRKWKNYCPEILNIKLLDSLESVNVVWHDLNAQEHWNRLENILVNLVDELAPLVPVNENENRKHKNIPTNIKSSINLRKRLLRLEKERNSIELAPRIKVLNKSIRDHFVNVKINRGRSATVGPTVNIWKAVNLAKNVNVNSIPKNLTRGGVPVAEGTVAESFANFFRDKIGDNVSKTNVNSNAVYNGKCKLIVQNRNFMQKSDIKACMNVLNTKKCEGFDRIPVCILADAKAVLLDNLTGLFQKISCTL